jgi:hypothetical protein
MASNKITQPKSAFTHAATAIGPRVDGKTVVIVNPAHRVRNAATRKLITRNSSNPIPAPATKNTNSYPW